MNKYERIEFVRELGLNTEENILIKPDESITIYQDFIEQESEFSIRTFRGDDLKTPHCPIVKKSELYTILDILQKDNYDIILARPINPKDCEFAGAIRKTLDSVIVEIADGPCTVRRVTHEGIIDKRYVLDYFKRGTTDYKINSCLSEINKTGLTDVIFEFSYYKIPVGYKNQNFICWEITGDGTEKWK